MNWQSGKRYETDDALPPAGAGLSMPCPTAELLDREAEAAAHVCKKDRKAVVRAYPQGDLFIEIECCTTCFPDWADVELSEVLK